MIRGGGVVVLRYHEVALKGRNRPYFVRRLAEHVERATAGLPVGRPRAASARLLLPLRDAACWSELRERLARVFGVANFSLAHEVPLAGGEGPAALAPLADAVLAALAGATVPSFRVQTKRADKRFPLDSPAVNAWFFSSVTATTGARVDLRAPALTIAVELLPGHLLERA